MRVLFNSESLKTVVVPPWPLEQIMEGGGRDRVANVQEAFSRIPLIFRCTRLRCNTLARVPVHVFKGGKEVDAYPFEDSLPLKELIWKTEASLLLAGKSASVILTNEQGFDVGLQWMNPFTFRVVERLNGLGRYERLFWQELNGERFPKEKEFWTQDEVYYIREFSVESDVDAGTAPAQVALGNAEIVHNVSRFLNQFFKGGAMPITLVSMQTEKMDEPQRERIQNFFERAMLGVRRAFRVLVTNKQTSVQTITPEIKSFDIKQLDAHAIEFVCDAFDIPTSLIRAQAKTKAIADAERESFINDTVWARAELHEAALNKLLAPYGYSVDFAIEEMPEMQENEEERSVAVMQYVNAGFSLAAACGILGVQVPEEFQKELEASKEKKLRQAQAVPASMPTPPTPPPAKSNGHGQFRQDMERWQRKALNRLREGKSAAVEFESEHIPKDVSDGMMPLLSAAKTEEQVKAIFVETLKHYAERGVASWELTR